MQILLDFAKSKKALSLNAFRKIQKDLHEKQKEEENKKEIKEEPEAGDEFSTTVIASKLLSLEKERSTTWFSPNI